MSDPQNFLARWSRRKRDAAQPGQAEEPPAPEPARQTEPKAADAAQEPNRQDSLELADLPSIETIAADTDVRGFLQPGVPEPLTRAALRRAWSADPAIRDFVGLVENGWDFNDPNGAAGFGPLAPEEASRLLAQTVEALTKEQPSADRLAPPDKSLPQSAQLSTESAAARSEPSSDAAPQNTKSS